MSSPSSGDHDPSSDDHAPTSGDHGAPPPASSSAPRRAETPRSYLPTKLRLLVVAALTALVLGTVWYATRPSSRDSAPAPGSTALSDDKDVQVVASRHPNGQPRLVMTYPSALPAGERDSTRALSRRHYTSGGILYRREGVQAGRVERYGDLYPEARDTAIWRYLSGLWRRTPHASQPAPLPGGGEGRVRLVEERLFRRDTMIVRQLVTLRKDEEVIRSDDYRTAFQMERRSPGIIAPTERLFEYKNGERRYYAPGDSMRLIPDDLRRAVADTLVLQHPDRFDVVTTTVASGHKRFERIE